MKKRYISATQTACLVRFVSCTILPLVTSLTACSGETVTMGEDGNGSGSLPAYSRCLEDTTVRGDLLVDTQEQLNTLEGCQVIDGSLVLFNIEGADLRPLHALTTVRGDLTLNMIAWPQETFPGVPLLESLEGLESVQSVRNLELSGLIADNLEPLGNLETLTGGRLSIAVSPNLTNLDGIAKLNGVNDLHLLSCPALEDIAPLTLQGQMNSLVIESTKLSQLSPLGLSAVWNALTVKNTELQNLDAFKPINAQYVIDAPYVSIEDNPRLENIDALNYLEYLVDLRVSLNPSLTHLPEFPNLGTLGSFVIVSNDRLAELPAFQRDFSAAALDPIAWPSFSQVAIIADNPALTTIALTPIWFGASELLIDNNPALTHVTLTNQFSFYHLRISGNTALTFVDVGILETVNLLELKNNPQLDARVFDSVRTFETRISDAETP